MKLYVKFMVSLRCKLIVKQEVTKLDYKIKRIDLGVVEIYGEITQEKRDQLSKRLKKFGMELLDDTRSSLIKKIENETIDIISDAKQTVPENIPVELTQKLGYQPEIITSIFSEVKGISLDQYIITQKIERAKELILYDEMRLKDISKQLHLKSRENLSYHFKKITGLTPSFFKYIRQKRMALSGGKLKDKKRIIGENTFLD
jgi:AraC-like DNA-binding protein